jgi:hypothetical protein
MCFKYKYTVLSSHINAHLKDKGKHKAVKANQEYII